MGTPMRIFEQWSTRKCFVLFSIYGDEHFFGICILNVLFEWARTERGQQVHTNCVGAARQFAEGEKEIWRA